MIYSPSQSKSFLECPTKRLLNQEGWVSRVVDLRSWVAWVGQGVHAGMAHLYSKGATGAIKAGLDEFSAHLTHARGSERIIPGAFFEGEARANIERCLQHAITSSVLPVGFEVDRVEQSLGDYNCILDVVGRKNGKPTFIDYKVKNKCKPDYIDQTLETYRYDWKEARHYPWALSEVCGQRVEEYTVVMFILQPFKVVSRTYAVNWKVVERWAQGCQGVGRNYGLWDVMDNIGGDENKGIEDWQSNACMGGQWPCEYLDACWTYDLDREKMRQGGLVQVQRMKKEVNDDQV